MARPRFGWTLKRGGPFCCAALEINAMSSASSLRYDASQIAGSTTDPKVKKLAEIVKDLCEIVENIEKTAGEALTKAKRANRAG